MADDELKEEQTKEINGVKLTNLEISEIAMICDYLVLDRFNDISSFFRFEKCFGPLLYKEGPNFLIEAFQEICGPKKKYINFGRLISAYIKWKTNSSQNESFNKFMDIVFNKMIKKENEVVGKLEEGTRIFSTRNVRGRKVISKFSVFTDSSKNIIQGFNIQYDDFFDSLLCSRKKEGQDKNITLEMNFLPNGKTILDRDGISHIAGKFSVREKMIKFLIFKCRSGKTFYIGDNTENENEEIELFIFGTSSCQLKTLRIETIDDKLAYLEPKFQPSLRLNQKIISFDLIDEKFINEEVINCRLIFEENEIQNIAILDKKILLIPCIPDDQFITDKSSLVEQIDGKNFNEIYKSFTVREKEENEGKKEEEKVEEENKEEGEEKEGKKKEVAIEEKKKFEEKLLDKTVKRRAILKFYLKKFKIKENLSVLKSQNKPKEDRINMDKYLAKIKRFKKKVNIRKEENKKELENIESNPLDDYEQEEDWPQEENKNDEEPKEEGKIEINEIKEEEKKEEENKKEEEVKNEEKIEIEVEGPNIEEQQKEEIIKIEEEPKNEEKIEIEVEGPKLEEQPKAEEKIEINEVKEEKIDNNEVNIINSEENKPTEKIRLRGNRPKKLLNKRLNNKNENPEDQKIEDKKENVEEKKEIKEEKEKEEENKNEIILEQQKEENQKEDIIKIEEKKEENTEEKKEEKVEEKKESIENKNESENLNNYEENKIIEVVKEEPAKNEEEVQTKKSGCANCTIS